MDMEKEHEHAKGHACSMCETGTASGGCCSGFSRGGHGHCFVRFIIVIALLAIVFSAGVSFGERRAYEFGGGWHGAGMMRGYGLRFNDGTLVPMMGGWFQYQATGTPAASSAKK